MFTGIVTAIGRIHAMERRDGGLRIGIAVDAGEFDPGASRTGDSVSVAGVCLTMIDPREDGFQADVSAETRAHTTLGIKREGDRVNLELALRAGDRLGGHLVSGHVDASIKLLSRDSDGDAERLEFELPAELAGLVCRKGSVCLDGVSLTVNAVAHDRFGVCVIPHTLMATTLGELKVGHLVNLEVDQIARYVARLAEGQWH